MQPSAAEDPVCVNVEVALHVAQHVALISGRVVKPPSGRRQGGCGCDSFPPVFRRMAAESTGASETATLFCSVAASP